MSLQPPSRARSSAVAPPARRREHVVDRLARAERVPQVGRAWRSASSSASRSTSSFVAATSRQMSGGLAPAVSYRRGRARRARVPRHRPAVPTTCIERAGGELRQMADGADEAIVKLRRHEVRHARPAPATNGFEPRPARPAHARRGGVRIHGRPSKRSGRACASAAARGAGHRVAADERSSTAPEAPRRPSRAWCCPVSVTMAPGDRCGGSCGEQRRCWPAPGPRGRRDPRPRQRRRGSAPASIGTMPVRWPPPGRGLRRSSRRSGLHRRSRCV